LFWRRGQIDTATLLLGASDSERVRADVPLQHNEQRLIAEARTALEAQLHPDAFASSLAAGAALGGGELLALISEALAQPLGNHRWLGRVSILVDVGSPARRSSIACPQFTCWRSTRKRDGPNLPDLFRRAASYVAKILGGAKPTDLPVDQPTKFGLTINLKTAKALGLTIPQSLLLHADEVIQ
jgi:hypothetical protein